MRMRAFIKNYGKCLKNHKIKRQIAKNFCDWFNYFSSANWVPYVQFVTRLVGIGILTRRVGNKYYNWRKNINEIEN